MKNLHADLTARMKPAWLDIEMARFAIEEEGTEMALTPIFFPGKEYGIWTADTEVDTVAYAVACNNDDSYRDARETVLLEAVKAMGERPGTVGYVVHRIVDGETAWSVFEEILSPADVLKFAEAR